MERKIRKWYKKRFDSEIESIKHVKGHVKKLGVKANKEVNDYYELTNKDNKKYYFYKLKEKMLILDDKSFNKIKRFEEDKETKITWHLCNNGYVGSKVNNDFYYLHQIVMNYYGNGKGTKNGSVDHINRDKLNNCHDNLRITTDEIQQKNKIGCLDGTKRKRQSNAIELPDGIEQKMIPKYCIYRKECYNVEKKLYREYFVYKHPDMEKRISSSKSSKVSIKEKLNEIKLIEKNYLEKNIVIKEKEFNLPNYVSFKNNIFVYDEKTSENRYNLKYKVNNELDFESNLKQLEVRLNMKYSERSFNFAEFYNSKKITKVENIILPKYFSRVFTAGKYHIQFDKREKEKRYSMKIVMKTENINEEIKRLVKKLLDKFPELKNMSYIPKEYIEKEEILKKEKDFKLPKCFSITTEKGLKYIIFQKKFNEKRYVKKFRLHNENIKQHYLSFKNKLILTNPELKELLEENDKKQEEKILPKNISIINVKGDKYLLFQKNINGKRIATKMKINNNLPGPGGLCLEELLPKFIEKVNSKFNQGLIVPGLPKGNNILGKSSPRNKVDL